MSTSLSIVGSSRKNGDRPSGDFYPTPAYVVDALLEREEFVGNIWEPACGEGHISKILINNGYEVISSDLIDRGYGSSSDFLLTQKSVDNIITNPPYSHALEFVIHSKKCARKKIAMFLKTVFLESESRKLMFLDQEFPLKTMYQFSKRVTLYKNGYKLKNSGMISYAWFVWDRDFRGYPTIQWI